jgi:hypothetical protein
MSKEERIEAACTQREYQSKNLTLLLTLLKHADFEQVPVGKDKAYSRWNIKYHGQQLRSDNFEAALGAMA